MKKFVNQIDQMLQESLQGFAEAHAELVNVYFDPTFVTRARPATDKVVLISGGGSGHEPLHAGYVGRGMLDAACPGQVFTSPTPDQMLAAAEAVHAGKGVLFIVKNYAGDVMNFEMAAEMLPFEQATVLTSDDCAVVNSTYTTGRRGVAGTVIVEKCVGSLAESGADLQACQAFAAHINLRTSSIGVALSSCTVPAAGRPTFTLGEQEIEMGVGIHGEPGRRREALRSADAMVADMVAAIVHDLTAKELPTRGDILLLVNGLGGTPLMELYLIYHAAARALAKHGLQVKRRLVGNYTTAIDMAGASISVCLLDEAIEQHWDSPVHTAGLRWGC